MPLTVEIPEIGEVEFPDSMTEADIATASNNLYAERKGVPPTAQPLPVVPFIPGMEEPRPIKEGLEPIVTLPRYEGGPAFPGQKPPAALEVGGGLYNALAGAAESLTSPASVVTMGIAGAEQGAAKLAAGIWSLFMAKAVPEQVSEARKAFKEGRPLSQKTEAVLAPIINATFAATAGKAALTPERVAPLTTAEIGKAQEQARVAGLPSQEPFAPEKPPFAPTEPSFAEKPPSFAQERPPFAEAPKAPETPPVVPEPAYALEGPALWKIVEEQEGPTAARLVKALNEIGLDTADTHGREGQPITIRIQNRWEDVPWETRQALLKLGRVRSEPKIAIEGVGEMAITFDKDVSAEISKLEKSPATIPEQPVKAAEAVPEKPKREFSQREQDKIDDALSDAEVTANEILERDPAYQKEQSRVAAFEEEIADMEKIAADRNNPDRKSAASRVNELEVDLEQIQKGIQQIRERTLAGERQKAWDKVTAEFAPEEAPTPTPAATPPSPEPAISFPGIGSLREKQATAMELGKIRKAEPELWKAITAYFGETQPGKVTKAAQAAFKRQREQESRAASAGPGAASPVEFEQRARAQGDAAAAGQKPPGDNPPVATDASASPSIEITRANRDYNILNRVNSGQFAFWFGKLGEAAKQAWERMALGEFRMRESIGRDTKRYVDQLLDGLPRPFRKKGGEAFFDVVNGRKFEGIEAEWAGRDGGAEVIGAARELKTRLEEIRTTIRDTKREAYTAYLNSLDRPILEGLFKKNIDEQLDIGGYPKESIADALVKDAYRDDWGIADGSYLPHLFFGNWKVTATDAAGESRFVTRSKTPEEAKAEIYKFVQRNPELKDATFNVEQDTVVPADMIRLGDRRFWQLVGKMKEATGLTQAEVRQAQQGIIGKKSSKQKWFGSLQKREGYEGYSRDYRQVMTAYLNGFHRWLELSQMQRDVQPLIETVRREGRQNAAARLDELMENLWGKPARTTLEFDALVRRIPGLRDFIKPLALDRWGRNVRSIVAMLTLKTLRFGLVNRLQPLQGLYPIVGERILAEAKLRQHTAEGRALLDEAGVSFDPGQYRAERAGAGKLQTLSERLSGEKSNQELAFLAMFQHGTERGLSRTDAINYAKLRGQLFTQFTPLIADTPQLMQGPFAGVLFQFKRFPVKQAELLTRLVQEKQIGGIARWLGVMALAGGASYFLRQVYADAETKKRLRDKLAEQHGEKVADGIMYGMPGLIGADLSGSLVLGDEPFGANIYERTGRAVAGPAVSMAIDTGRALGTEAREPTTSRQDAVRLLRRFPTLRPLGEVLSLDDLDVRTPDGEVRYRKALKDALLGLGSFRSANESNIKLAVDAMFELKKEIAELKNRYFVESEQGDPSKADAAIDKFNERWPELEIRRSELLEYSKLRRRGLDKTDVERISGKKLEPLAP